MKNRKAMIVSLFQTLDSGLIWGSPYYFPAVENLDTDPFQDEKMNNWHGKTWTAVIFN